MPLKDLLKKKDRIRDEGAVGGQSLTPPEIPEFTFMRTTTTSQEVIEPPSFPGDAIKPNPQVEESKRHTHRFRRSSNATPNNLTTTDAKTKADRRLSERLHLGSRSRTTSSSSINLPADLPEIQSAAVHTVEDEAKWEKRATLLAQGNSIQRAESSGSRPRSSKSHISIVENDDDIQEAIRLHEAGDLEKSTAMFGRLADPNGANNALSQVLYGMALRHGWGCEPSPEQAISYLSYAAANAAQVEALALDAGMKKGGAAKGELVLAMFELANCFRHGWGIKKDAVAAKQYYETAANLGDTDAMGEVAWCYIEGFGCKKDKFKAAQYLRLAEEKGSKTVGNSW
ncbi:HCP-like protein [Patellaria atrata CBS 101060]|uniref:HCP-like protein n=1 Tax=Patellaria atrata CBS 101060 TaxID=1346257 RepID=A0A9P4S6G2_9PEZI|nr:HCP-like protein [Patellaria atrata CBS 101060]